MQRTWNWSEIPEVLADDVGNAAADASVDLVEDERAPRPAPSSPAAPDGLEQRP